MAELPQTVPQDVERRNRVDAPRPEAEVYHHREQRSVLGTDPLDGLPRQMSESSYEETTVPPLDPETFVCMADTSEFTLQSGAQLLATFTLDEVQRDADGRYFVSAALALKRTDPNYQHQVAFHPQRGVCYVEPRRRPCKHYMRQMTDFAANRGRKFVARFCTALRDETGEYLSLRDALMYACDLRDPPEPTSQRALDQFDADKIAEGRERAETDEAEFDVDAALADQNKK